MTRTRLLFGAFAMTLALSVSAASVALATGRPLHAQLTAASEVPGPGDVDATGHATFRLNQGRHRICYRVEVTGLTLPAAGAHIHAGAAGELGDVVVELTPPDGTGVSSGCVTDLERSLIKDMRKHPAQYYVNVHTSDFSEGAVRGQLSKWAPGRP